MSYTIRRLAGPGHAEVWKVWKDGRDLQDLPSDSELGVPLTKREAKDLKELSEYLASTEHEASLLALMSGLVDEIEV